MELTIVDPVVKRISFDTFKKFFVAPLKANTTNYNELFYKKLKDGLEISFCSSCFIVICFVSYQEIVNQYKDLSPNDAAGELVPEEDNLLIAKFYMDFLMNRAIITE